MHTQLISKSLQDKGFETKVSSNGVQVSLNRPMNQMEIETALEDEFEGIKFQFTRTSKNSYNVKA
jgi:hypothetical protein